MTVDNGAAPGVLKVAIDAPLRTPFDYLPPDGLTVADVPVGSRVRVPVGARETVGVVVEHGSPAREGLKLRRAHALVDAEPVLDPALLRLLRWTADYYHHPIGEVMAAALPKALRAGEHAAALIERWLLTAAGAEALAAGAVQRAPKRRALLELLASHPEGLEAQGLNEQLPSWRDAARATLAQGWIERVEVEIAAATSGEEGMRGEAPELSPEQREAIERVDAAAGDYGVFVLQGATGSGKTEVYLQCAARTLARGRSVLILVPEIGLTPQLVGRFRARLAMQLAVLHSGLSDTERLNAWRAAREGRARAILGTRSAVFASIPELGLIVVDEEHDASYKQHDGGCRYSARDLAVVRAQQQRVPVVLGTATPSFETLQNTRLGRYQVLPLPRRADQAPPPRLALVDLRAHPVRHGLSNPVIESIQRHLAQNGQVLVFINRRGYAPSLLCTSCGWIAPCQHCDARMTVHRLGGELRCHHCGAAEALPTQCRRCGFTVKAVGQGTERVEEALRELFPAEPLLRLDRDTAGTARELEDIMARMTRGEARILVGTQMVTKGHHFPALSLVVVLNADLGLFSTDFRAAERLAQTIVQVAGRAGRERERGEVLIQTEYPEHPLLQDLLGSGYEGFAVAALAEREAAHWPPFGRLALLRASSSNAEGAMKFLAAARRAAPTHAQVRMLGPVASAMARRAGRYYAQLLLESAERGALHRFIDEWLAPVEALARTHRVRYALDVDPLDIQ